jgi:hypothetical protein
MNAEGQTYFLAEDGTAQKSEDIERYEQAVREEKVRHDAELLELRRRMEAEQNEAWTRELC